MSTENLIDIYENLVDSNLIEVKEDYPNFSEESQENIAKFRAEYQIQTGDY